MQIRSIGMTLAFVMSFVVTLIVLIVLLRTRLSKIALDQPNHRSLHTKLVPRTGGVAMMAGILSAWMLTDNPWLRSEEHTSELQSIMRISYAVYSLKKKIINHYNLRI